MTLQQDMRLDDPRIGSPLKPPMIANIPKPQQGAVEAERRIEDLTRQHK